MIYTNMTKKAMKYMFEHQKNQFDKSGVPYIFHPFTVAFNLNNETECVVALLHDIVEGTSVSFDENEGFSDNVIDILELLTHNMQYGRLKEITEKDIIRKKKI